MVDKTWRNEWLKLKSVKNKIKTLADACLKRCNHSAGPGQECVGRQAKRALFTSVLNCCCMAPVTRSVASVPCQHSCRTFLDYKVGTRPEPCGFQGRKQSCTLSNFVVNLGIFCICYYVQVQNRTRQYCTISCGVPMQHCAIPSMHRVCSRK